MFLDAALHGSAGFFEHFGVLPYVVKICDLSMPRNDFYVWRKFRHDLFHGRDHAFHAAAGGEVDEGEAIANEIVAHVHDVRLRKENDAVAIGVSAREVKSANV